MLYENFTASPSREFCEKTHDSESQATDFVVANKTARRFASRRADEFSPRSGVLPRACAVAAALVPALIPVAAAALLHPLLILNLALNGSALVG